MAAIPWAVTFLLAMAICAAPLAIWGVPLRWFELKADDFAYLARSRSAASLRDHLIAPHNGHIVPLFLVETHVLARLAGTLEALPNTLRWASYLTLVMSALLTGHVVAWETGRAAWGLIAMAAVAFTSVLGTVLLWYSAGQALAAGAMILLMLAALQAWRSNGRWWSLLLGAMAALAAPLLWTAGYTAGLVGCAYLWADGRRRCRRAALLPLAISVITFCFARIVMPRFVAVPADVSPVSTMVKIEPGSAVVHTAQGICEALIFNNLGLDAPTTGSQALVIVAMLAVIWTLGRHRPGLPGQRLTLGFTPLEAAGAVLVISSFGMIFAVRGAETTFDGLRALGWYDAIPELGAVLFAAGWWSGPADPPPPAAITPPSAEELLIFVLVAVIMLVLQIPRADRVIFQYDGLSAQYRQESVIRTPAELRDKALVQRHALATLDQLEHTARLRGLDRTAVATDARRVQIPGMPVGFPGVGAAELLDLPDSTPKSLDPDQPRNRKGNG
jgi:hypothetical protein